MRRFVHECFCTMITACVITIISVLGFHLLNMTYNYMAISQKVQHELKVEIFILEIKIVHSIITRKVTFVII